MRLISTTIAIFLIQLSFGQHKLKVNGNVQDRLTSSPLIGATVYLSGTSIGAITNEHGIYSLYVPKGNHRLVASYLGYISDTISVEIENNTNINFQLELQSIQGEEVIIRAKDPEKNIKGVETGSVMLTMREIQKLPTLMGESDFMRIIQMSPGISAANDGNSGFYVRGGGADQNLVLLDNATVYNPSHVMGFFSVFNSKTIANTKLIKSGMPAYYGGRLSSIINFTSRDGNFEKHETSGNIGIISSGISVEGPIVKNKLSFIMAARRSYIDEVLKPAIRPFAEGSSTFYDYSKYYFYDLNGKLSYNIDHKNKLTLTLYKGADKYSLEEFQLDFKNQMDWGNDIASLNWYHSFSNNLKLATSLSVTKYEFELVARQNKVNIDLYSGIRDYTFKSVFTNIKDNGSIIKYGIEHIFHTFRPNNIEASTNDVDLQFGSNRELNSHESSVFYNHEFDLIPRLRISAGLRATNFMHVGPYYQKNKNLVGEVTDTTVYSQNEIIKTYQSLEPRISMRYQLDRFSSLKASYTRNAQFIHLASSSSVTLPTDVWLPSTNLIKPQRSEQYTIGYFRNFEQNLYTSSINIYYKNFYNQIELLSGFMNNFHDNIFEESITFGTGYSYGTEVFLQKTSGKFTGWIGYTLSRTMRQFDEINEGKIYPAKYDRTHDINIIASYDISHKWSISGTFIYATGNALTLPEGKYVMDGNVITHYGSINSFRMPDYHRLDISINYMLRKTKKFESALNLSVFNVYNRANPFFIYFQITGNVHEGNLDITPKQVVLFPILPSITWNFRF